MGKKTSKLILITGGRIGLGKALAESLIKENATVIVTSRQAQFQENMRLTPGEIHLQQLDVTQESSVLRLFSWLKSMNYPLDVLVNNAGFGIFNSIENTSTAEWDLIIKTNLTGAFLCSKEAYRIMKEHHGGRIINIGSIANKVGLNNNLAYGASKWGLKGLSINLGEEGKHFHIRVTHVTLGATYTEIWNDRPGFSKSDMLDPELVARCLSQLVFLPLEIAVNEIEILPEKGVL
ncbi:SDR family oxidoreductase [Legionella cherrii]|uniref:L-allo-threonine dehydrogenase, NAD(P)-binding n=1 Tax=Legionella cherrii TaxID=28084 RepID=A0A0W0S8Q1_9GAMM|nr:SDR family oxidoreductase [Legionella cherrii]KTC79799.1 oxidoreductase, short chain dehydrogenase/reductase family [Legionella cherrii]VEB38004.1 L-allo-threonine dehydrogenase, NAD(P)-binding [Legionella cherrii]